MPFEKGHTKSIGNKGGGRKGYEWEAKQHKKMVSALTRLLNLHSKIYSGRASDKEITRYETLEKMGLKMMDKLHASKQHTEMAVDDTISEVNITIKKNENSKSTIDNSVSEELRTIPEEGKESNN